MLGGYTGDVGLHIMNENIITKGGLMKKGTQDRQSANYSKVTYNDEPLKAPSRYAIVKMMKKSLRRHQHCL